VGGILSKSWPPNRQAKKAASNQRMRVTWKRTVEPAPRPELATMITGIALLVLRCTDLAGNKAFYEALGLAFRAAFRSHRKTGLFTASRRFPK
jgi:hypothetical protein